MLNELINPYPGLRPFSMDESHLFFGREGQVDEVLEKLRENKFVAVTGSSGSGKSSMIYCGVIPKILKKGKWKLVATRPGNSPLENLAAEMVKVTSSRKPSEAELSEIVSSGINIHEILSENHRRYGNGFLIIIDQFEELFRYSETGDISKYIKKRNLFVEFLVDIVKQDDIPVYIIMTMRSDFMGECSRFQDFTEMINRSSFLIPRMTEENIRKVITGPAEAAGVEINPALVKRLLEDLGDNPDQLPILQHALMRTFNYWKGHDDPSRSVGVGDYESIGGIRKALSQHADEAYDELRPAQKSICERMFRSLTEKGSDSYEVRRPTEVSKLAAIAQVNVKEIIEIVEVFRAPGRSFLTPAPPVDLNENCVIDLSHESLMRIWDRLRRWVDEESASVQMYKRLAESASLYQIGKVGLWRPPDLQLAINWRKKNNPNLAWAIRHDSAYERTMIFLETSEREFHLEEENKIVMQKRRLRRTRIFALVFGSISIVTLVLIILIQKQRAEIELEVVEKENQRMLAEQKTLEAEEQRARAEMALRDARQQTTRADSALIIAETQRTEAERNAMEAANQAALAQQNLGEANRQKVIAVQNEQEAEVQRTQAEIAREEAFQRRMLSTARSMAVKSLQVSEDPELKALLAYQAFKFSREYNGANHDVDLYTGLYNSLKALLGKTYNVYKGHNNAVRTVDFLPGTSSFVSAGSDGKILKWNIGMDNRESAEILSGRNVIEKLEITPDGRWLLALENRNGLLLIDMKSGNFNPVQMNGGTDNNLRSLAIAPDNQTVYTAGLNNYIELWNISSRNGRKLLETSSRVNSLSISPDGSILAGGTRDGKTIIWSVGGEIASNEIFNDPGNAVQTVQFSPNGRYLACGTLNGNIQIFRADNFELAAVLSGHTARVTEIEFSNNSAQMASGSYDGKVLLWDMSNFTNPPIIMDDNEGFVFCVNFSPDGQYLVSGSTEEDRLVARPTSEALLANRICPLVNRNFTREEWNTYVGSDIDYRETCPANSTSGLE